jgi:hypothetical protein
MLNRRQLRPYLDTLRTLSTRKAPNLLAVVLQSIDALRQESLSPGAQKELCQIIQEVLPALSIEEYEEVAAQCLWWAASFPTELNPLRVRFLGLAAGRFYDLSGERRLAVERGINSLPFSGPLQADLQLKLAWLRDLVSQGQARVVVP